MSKERLWGRHDSSSRASQDTPVTARRRRVLRHPLGQPRAAVEMCWGGPTCGARRILAKPKLAWSECSATTSVHVHADVRITTDGPIAPDRRRRESALSRRAGTSVPSRKASFRRAEPGGAHRHISTAASTRVMERWRGALDIADPVRSHTGDWDCHLVGHWHAGCTRLWA